MSNESLLEKKTVRTVIDYLQNFDPNLSPIPLDTTARTAKEAAQSLSKKQSSDVPVGAILKSLVFNSLKMNVYYLCLVSGDKFISLKKHLQKKSRIEQVIPLAEFLL